GSRQVGFRSMLLLAEVAVCLPISRTFVYSLTDPAAVGCRVVAPFRGRDVEGFIVGFRETPPESVEVLAAREVMDREPLLPADVFDLCRWISSYYFAPLGEVLKAALPPGLTQKRVDRITKTENRAAGA